MRPPRPLPADLLARPFSVHDADARGIPRGRLRARDLAAPFRGVRTATDDAALASTEALTHTHTGAEYWDALRTTTLGRAHAYATAMSSKTIFSHTTAAIIHGLYLPAYAARDLTLHIGAATHSDRRRGATITPHVLPRLLEPPSTIDGMRVTSPLDTWLHLAQMLPLDDVIVMGDQLAQRRHPFATLQQLDSAVRFHAGKHGVSTLRDALDWIRPGTDSPRETQLRCAIVRAGLPEPAVNEVVLDTSGAYVRRFDLVYRRYRICLDYDGDGHRVDRDQFERDVDVHDVMAAEGWRSMRVLAHHLDNDARHVTTRLAAALRERGWTGRNPPFVTG